MMKVLTLYDVLGAYCDVRQRQRVREADKAYRLARVREADKAYRLARVREADKAYRLARVEHAFLLRAEGLRYKDIGERLGVCTQRARQLAMFFSRRMRLAMRHTKVYPA